MTIQLDLPDFSTEGGEAVGYFREAGELILIEVKFFGEMGRSESSILWHDVGSFIFLERQLAYNRPAYLDKEAAMWIGDTEAFDSGKTVVVERFVCFDNGKEVYAEYPPKVDRALFMSSADLLAMADTLQSMLMTAYGAKSERATMDQFVRVELLQPTRPTAIDTAMAGVVMGDATSALRVLGSTGERRLMETERYPMPHASYSDPDRTIFATFSLHYGAGYDQYAEMELSRAEPDTTFGVLKRDLFRSSLGIELGMSKEKVEAILGSTRTVGKGANGNTLLSYRIDDLGNTGVLKGYALPTYYITAEFDAVGLVEYRFGFEYP
ncbi:MAG: hypothetical protein JNM62_02825 [Flavobacteriales bacterium]|nr:hypothetical protein [Flavobacteriales bacterium]